MPRVVLFVCVGNAGRSQMAEAIFNKLKPGGFLAISAGTRPASEVNPLVIQALNEIEIDTSDSKPKSITQNMIESAEKIVTMGCEATAFCPARLLSKVEDWGIEDPKGKSLDEIKAIRDRIRSHVEALLLDLGAATRPQDGGSDEPLRKFTYAKC